VQALIRLLQLIHVVGDVITDWDSIIDCVEQILLLPPSSTKSAAVGADDSISASDMDKVLSAFQRLISYSAFLSDDSLVKLMSSLVALSLNSLETSSHSHQPNFKVPKSSIFRANEAKANLPYLADCLSEGMVGFSFQAVIEVAKLNAHRVSCVWQMVSSHLRMIASYKVRSAVLQFH
jgi:hypothetical protein